MPNESSLHINYEATLEELAGASKNRRFNEIIDDDATHSIQIICKRGDEEIPLAKPSRAFYFGDRNLYEQEAQRFDHEVKARILNTDLFPRNLKRFEELKRACQRGFVIPFVGAGMSKSVGCPDWTEYLLGLCDDARLDIAVVRDRLTVQADYEGVMNDLVKELGENRFNIDFERDFKTPENITGAITLLPRLFDNCAITTNFDRVIEQVYINEGRSFVEKVSGRGLTRSFIRAIPAGERYLLKLHGNLDNAEERVLTRTEYDMAYGDAGNILMDFPLPKLLNRLFTSYSFFFLGCSLTVDRTIQTFMVIAQREGQDNLPHHYALLDCPAETDQRLELEQRLANAHITPIWHPCGEYRYIEQILELLLD